MNEWQKLVKKTQRENPDMEFSEVLKVAKKHYHGGG